MTSRETHTVSEENVVAPETLGELAVAHQVDVETAPPRDSLLRRAGQAVARFCTELGRYEADSIHSSHPSGLTS